MKNKAIIIIIATIGFVLLMGIVSIYKPIAEKSSLSVASGSFAERVKLRPFALSCNTYNSDCNKCGNFYLGDPPDYSKPYCATCEICEDEWRCNDAGYVRCGSTQTCGPSQDWCTNFLNGDKSCYNNRCCNTAEHIIDYTVMVCCPPTSPFVESTGKWCYTSPQPGSDNWFTRNSECKSGETKCIGTDYYKCQESSTPFLYQWKSQGKIKGQCGVECVYPEEKCNATDYYSCETYKFKNRGKVQGKCGVECTQEGAKKCDGFNLFICESYKWKTYGPTKGECGVECLEKTDCPSDGFINTEKVCSGKSVQQKYRENYCGQEIVNSDNCVKQKTSCCGCESGGTNICMTKEQAFAKEAELNCSKNIFCAEVYNCKDTICVFDGAKCNEAIAVANSSDFKCHSKEYMKKVKKCDLLCLKGNCIFDNPYSYITGIGIVIIISSLSYVFYYKKGRRRK